MYWHNCQAYKLFEKKVRKNRPNNHQAVRCVYDIQFSIPRNYTMDILGQQLLVYDNGRSDHVILCDAGKGF